MALIRDKYMRIESRAKGWETVVEMIKAEFMSLVQKEMKVALMVDVLVQNMVHIFCTTFKIS